ncbi:MAG: chlorite dismutase [Actinomycetales bacterium]|nr:chlorite dismutase [Actinomycetales bacterium]
MTTDDRTRPTAREINDTIRYTSWTVFQRTGAEPPHGAQADLESLVADLAAEDVVVRGWYDVSALRSNSDVMVWMHAASADQLQVALRRIRRSAVGSVMEQTFSAVGMHRPAEFNKSHVPAFLLQKEPREWVTVYPFVRSYEWYLLPEEERRAMLVEHGMMGRGYEGVLTNTVAAFALGDYEWILCLESDVLHDTVDLMRHLRGSEARRHVREEIPFYTGRLVDAAGVVDVLS